MQPHEYSTRVASSGGGPHRVRGRTVAVQDLAIAMSTTSRSFRRRRREPAPTQHAATRPPRRVESPRVADVVSCLSARLAFIESRCRYPACGEGLTTVHSCCGIMSQYVLQAAASASAAAVTYCRHRSSGDHAVDAGTCTKCVCVCVCVSHAVREAVRRLSARGVRRLGQRQGDALLPAGAPMRTGRRRRLLLEQLQEARQRVGRSAPRPSVCSSKRALSQVCGACTQQSSPRQPSTPPM